MGLIQNKSNFMQGKAAFESAASDVRNKGFVVARIDKLFTWVLQMLEIRCLIVMSKNNCIFFFF